MENRVLRLKQSDSSFNASGSVVYVMHRDQRLHDNHALLAAQHDAITRKLPLVIVFLLYGNLGKRAREHYRYIVDGLTELKQSAKALDIEMCVRYAGEGDVAATLQSLRDLDAASVYFDFSPLRHARALQKSIADSFSGAVYVVDTHNIIPVWSVSDKQEFAAHTIRRKVHLQLHKYLVEPPKLQAHPFAFTKQYESLSDAKIDSIIRAAPSNGTVSVFESGEQAAKHQLDSFLKNNLEVYGYKRNDIAADHQTNLSPYLHFGQISSLRVALEVLAQTKTEPLLYREAKLAQASGHPSQEDGMNALFEEMIVRKELADNFCFYNDSYDDLSGAADWALKSLTQHETDQREFTYQYDDFAHARTHDELWNAAQTQLCRSGKIHGYMRMYWAKKILEWSATPAEAVDVAIRLNDFYSIDGGDPNGYVGILWSIAGLHDRPWFDRPIYGKIRYMTDTGIAKKYDAETYKDQWKATA